MKKTILSMAVAATIMVSCTKEPIKNNAPAHAQESVLNALFSVSSATDQATTAKIKAFISVNETSHHTATKPTLQFDYNTTTAVTINNTNYNAYIVRQVGFNASAPVMYALGLYPDAYGNIKSSMIIKMEKPSTGFMTITYYTYDNIFIMSGTVNLSTGVFTPTSATSKMDVQTGPGKGQSVANCIQDAYSNHGWISVWATIQSALLPETAVAIAIACMM